MKFTTILLYLALCFLTGCVSKPPGNPNDICDIFDDKSEWYKSAKKSENKWGSSIPIMMSIMFQESQFKQNAKPARTKILWIFPGPRPSNAYGFAQVKSDTWDNYQDDTGNSWARRDNFRDAVDFIGWYNVQSQVRSKVKANDAYNLYLAYHEGHGGFNKGTYNKKGWLKSTAQQVATRSALYTKQLAQCEEHFKSSWWWPF